jgi:plasmid stability protein
MPVSLSIKNVPDDLAARLRARAARNHRSLQGELMAILQDASLARLENGGLSLSEFRRRIKEIGITTPEESVRMIREDRDNR